MQEEKPLRGLSDDTSDDENRPVDRDPFSPDNVQQVQLIVQMRLYDVTMALLTEINSEVAYDLYEAHKQGKILGFPPQFTGFEGLNDSH